MNRFFRSMTLGAAVLASTAALAGEAVTVKGSDTMVLLGQRWAEVYMQTKPGTKVQVTGGGSGTGIAALINGTSSSAESSGPMKAEEIPSAEKQQQAKVKETPVALDALSIYVNEANPLTEMS